MGNIFAITRTVKGLPYKINKEDKFDKFTVGALCAAVIRRPESQDEKEVKGGKAF